MRPWDRFRPRLWVCVRHVTRTCASDVPLFPGNCGARMGETLGPQPKSAGLCQNPKPVSQGQQPAPPPCLLFPPLHMLLVCLLCADGFRNCTALSVRIFGIPGPCVCESPYSLTFICNPRWLLGALPRPLGRVQRGGNRACPLGWAVAPGPVPAPTVNTCPFSCVLSATFPAFLCFFLVISLLTAPEPGPKVHLVFPRAGGWDLPSGENACVS